MYLRVRISSVYAMANVPVQGYSDQLIILEYFLPQQMTSLDDSPCMAKIEQAGSIFI